MLLTVSAPCFWHRWHCCKHSIWFRGWGCQGQLTIWPGLLKRRSDWQQAPTPD